MEKQTRKHAKTYQTDNGRDFISWKFKNLSFGTYKFCDGDSVIMDDHSSCEMVSVGIIKIKYYFIVW